MQLETQRLLSVKEAAKYLGITEHSLRKRIQTKQISPDNGLIRWDGRLFLDKNLLDKFIDRLRDEK